MPPADDDVAWAMSWGLGIDGAGDDAVTSPGPRRPPLARGERFRDVYDVVLLIDSREQFSRVSGGAYDTGRGGMLARLHTLDVRAVEERQIPVGDALWVARRKGHGGDIGDPEREWVLDLAVERKSLSDLVGSVRSGRLATQLHRLGHCGLIRPTLLIEGCPWGPSALGGQDVAIAVGTAARVAARGAGLVVAQTRDPADTAEWYAAATRTLISALDGSADEAPAAPPPTLGEVTRAAKAADPDTVAAVWRRALAQIGGLGPSGVERVASLWPTPALLRDAGRWATAETAASAVAGGCKPDVVARRVAAAATAFLLETLQGKVRRPPARKAIEAVWSEFG